MPAFACPHCTKTLVAKAAWAGKTTNCPKCGEAVTVPDFAAVPAPDIARTDAVPGAPLIDTGGEDPSPVRRRARRRKKSPVLAAAFTLGLLAAVGAGGYAVWVSVNKNADAPAGAPSLLGRLGDHAVDEGGTFTLTFDPAAVRDADARITLLESPDGAEYDAAAGRLAWTPTEADGPGTHAFELAVLDAATDAPREVRRFQVVVNERDRAPTIEPLPPQSLPAGTAWTFAVAARDPDDPARPLRYSLEGDVPPGLTVGETDGRLDWFPLAGTAGEEHAVSVRVTEITPDGNGATVTAPLRLAVVESDAGAGDEPVGVAAMSGFTDARATDDAGGSMPATAGVTGDEGVDSGLPELNDPLSGPLLALYRETAKGKARLPELFDPRAYEKLRSVFADAFAAQHADAISTAGADGSDPDAAAKEFADWLAADGEFRDDLFTAFEPNADDPAAGLAVLAELHREFGEKLRAVPQLAIATAVVWDDPRGPYRYGYHADRTRSEMPPDSELAGPVENVRFFLEREQATQGRARFLPWEFQTLLVDHPTPLPERDWALQRYVPERVMFGSVYSDVPYDDVMLETEALGDGSKQCRLGGKVYTLPNILTYGGVCAMQADFAARVGKSLGVPAAYVGGEGRYGGRHAWVMWVELKNVTRDSLAFTLESHGRYRGDNYYVGELGDPQTGARITDRDLERRLNAVGVNPVARRHAALAMRAWPLLRDRGAGGANGGDAPLDRTARLDYLEDVLGLDPWNAAAWHELAAEARRGGDELDRRERKRFRDLTGRLFSVFANLPDFTAEVFDGLNAAEPDAATRIEQTRRLLDLYAAAGRPDLAFAKLPVLVDLLTAADRTDDAVAALAAAVSKFADEGALVPPALDRLETLTADRPADLAQFYLSFLPKIPPTRGGTPSDYAISMHERAIERMRTAGRPDVAATLAARLEGIRAGRVRQ